VVSNQKKTPAQEKAERFIPLLQEIVAAGFTPPDSTGRQGKVAEGWVEVKWPWGTTKGITRLLAFRMRNTLYTVLGYRLVTNDSAHPALRSTENIIAWCRKLDEFAD